MTWLIVPGCGFAQPAQRMEFEVASVKPQPFAGSSGSVGIFVRGNTLNAEHVSLYDLVLYAYNLRDVQLSGGPAWAQSGVLQFSELFQVIAKVPGDSPPQTDVLRQMMQTLLADRFKLQIHHVQKDLPAYNLVVNKGGPKLKESAAETKSILRVSSLGRVGVRVIASHTTMEQLIDRQLDHYTDRPISDKTGLTAAYDFTLEFAVETASPGQEPGPDDPSALVTAVQEQLGLKLEPGKAPFDTVVIDHAEKPSEN